jgi:hypothetical protein
VKNQEASWISSKLIKVPRGVTVDTGIGLYVDLVIYDSANTLKAAYSNDPEKINSIYSGNTTWEDNIRSLDEVNGFIELAEEVDPTDRILATYYIEEEEYEFILVDFNPVNNLDILRERTVIYINPETSSTGDLDRSLHYLSVDPIGKIIYSSQADELGSDPVTTKMLAEDFDADGIPTHTFYYDTPSTDAGLASRTTIGLNIDEFSFIDKYTVESRLLDETTTYSGSLSGALLDNFTENARLLVLGDISVNTNQDAGELNTFDIRVRGGGIKDTYKDTALATQAEVSWYWDIGMTRTYPGMGAFYVEVPKSIYTDFGGSYDKDQVRALIEQHMKVGGYAVVRPYGYDPVVIDTSSTSGTIGFTWPSYGPAMTYNVYLSVDNQDFVLMSGSPYIDAGPNLENTLSIPGLIPGAQYYVYVAAVNEDGYDEAGPIVKILSRANDL